MSLFVPFKRATLLIPSGPVHDSERKHLFVLLTDPIEAPNYEGKQVLLVNILLLSLSMTFLMMQLALSSLPNIGLSSMKATFSMPKRV